jgi:hypothetical protein
MTKKIFFFQFSLTSCQPDKNCFVIDAMDEKKLECLSPKGFFVKNASNNKGTPQSGLFTFLLFIYLFCSLYFIKLE